MKYYTGWVLVLGMFCAEIQATHTSTYVEFDPPLLLIPTAQEQMLLRRMQDRLESKPAFRSLQNQAEKVLSRPPVPLQSISYEGHVSNHPDRVRSVRHLQDMLILRNLTWAAMVTGDARYQAQARAYLLAWIRTYVPTGNDVNDNKLDSCFFAFHVLKETLAEPERHQVQQWFTRIGTLHKDRWRDKAGGNRAAKRIKLVLLSAVMGKRGPWLTWAREKMPLLIVNSLHPDGRSDDLLGRDSMHYHDSCLEVLLEIALIGRLAGLDLYALVAPNGASIKHSIHYMLPYIRGDRIHREWVHSKAAIDRRRWESGDPYYRPGKPWNPAEAYDTLLLASIFDASLVPMITSLQPPPGKTHPWLSVVTRAIRQTSP